MRLADLVNGDNALHQETQHLWRQSGSETDRRILDVHEIRTQGSYLSEDAWRITQPPASVMHDLDFYLLLPKGLGKSEGVVTDAADIRRI